MPDLTTYNTPIDRAKALIDELVTFAATKSYRIPEPRYAHIGEIVRDCQAVIVSVSSLTPDPTYDPVNCISPRSATFLVDIIRSCAVVYDNNGQTITDLIEQVSETGSDDGQFLYEFAQEIDGWSSKQAWSVVWSIAEAGLQVTSLQITIGIP